MVYEGKDVTVNFDGVDYTAHVGIVRHNGWRHTSTEMDDRGIYWMSDPEKGASLTDDEFNEIASALCDKYDAEMAAE